MIYVSEGLLYIAFAVLTGSLLLRIVPEKKRPAIEISDHLLLFCVIAIPMLSFIPLNELTNQYAEAFDMSYSSMLKSMLLDMSVGKAWLWTTIGAIGLYLLLGLKSFKRDKHTPKVALFVTLLLMVWLGYASHASSLFTFKGLITHAIHFMAVSIWLGILFIVAWFSKDQSNWPSFLGWFSPLSIISVSVAIFAGLLLMSFTTPEYLNSWILPYGQAMLIKHLLIVPLLLLGYTNGFLYKKLAAQQPGFNPRSWLRAESVIGLLVLGATAFMGQQAPPHKVKETLQSVSPSPLFSKLYNEPFSPDIALRFSLQLEGILMFAAAAVMAFGILQMYRADKPAIAFIMGILTAVFGYFGLMFSIA